MIISKSQLFLPFDLEIKIEQSDPVKKLVEIMDDLDYTKLHRVYLRSWRKIDPAVMFELLVLGYMNGIYSSRGLEKACKTDIRFMWLLNGTSAPDHTSITRFQDIRLAPVIEDLFYQLAEKLMAMGEISYRHIFVDGTKIEANANRYTFVWAKAVEKNRSKLMAKITKELPEIQRKYSISESVNLTKTLEILVHIEKTYGIIRVNGKGRRKTQLQRDLEKFLEYSERLERYEKDLNICGKRKSYSKTDKDATFMRMKEDHMGNGQLKPCYNVQIGVESEYITGIGLFPNPSDTTTLIPFLERVQSRISKKIGKIVADAGYSSEENYTYLEQNRQEAYIKPNDYEIRKTRKYKKDVYRIENMPYDEESDNFTCPNGKRLSYTYSSKRKSDNGYASEKRNYVCESCAGCPHREQCFKGGYENRKISYSQKYALQKREADKRITSKEGIVLRTNRSIQVEGAFGVLKQDYAFRRFLMRGKQKTETQFFLLAMAFNIQKLCNRIENGRFNMSLFEKTSDEMIS